VPGYDPDAYESHRLWATAPDGVRVPISVVHRRGLPHDGTAPAVLYGYGSYESSMPPWFSVARLSLLDRGFVWALVHPRGGGELGRQWYLDGKLLAKRNTFSDTIAAAEHLVARGWSAPDRLAIRGGSAGGLLVGAAANMRPGLFKAVVAQVPFVDVVNTMLDPSLPLTTIEYIEWGNPADKTAFDYIWGYSPYDNLRPQGYPAMLVHVSLHDSQVPYWEGAKYVARLRELKTDDNPVLLKTNMGAGHGGASGRYDALRETAFTYAFILWQMGKADGPQPPANS
jgi:oligopeptidase B